MILWSSEVLPLNDLTLILALQLLPSSYFFHFLASERSWVTCMARPYTLFIAKTNWFVHFWNCFQSLRIHPKQTNNTNNNMWLIIVIKINFKIRIKSSSWQNKVSMFWEFRRFILCKKGVNARRLLLLLDRKCSLENHLSRNDPFSCFYGILKLGFGIGRFLDSRVVYFPRFNLACPLGDLPYN